MNPRTPKPSFAFAGLPLEQWNSALQRYFSRRLGNRQDVRELTQEVWLRLCRVTDREGLREPMAYVYRTAGNVLAEFQLRRRRDPVTFNTELARLGADTPAQETLGDGVERIHAQRDLLRALEGLPAAYRRIVWLRLCEDRSFDDIGKTVGFSTATARRYYFRAIKMLWQAEWA